MTSDEREQLLRHLLTARELLTKVSDDPALWNDRCDRANQNANNAMANVVCALRILCPAVVTEAVQPRGLQ